MAKSIQSRKSKQTKPEPILHELVKLLARQSAQEIFGIKDNHRNKESDLCITI
jgi:hypothetical protein